MNILILSWRDLKHPLAGGAEQVMHQHAKGWLVAGHTVTHFSSRVKQLPQEEIIDGIKVIRQGCQYLGVQLAAWNYYLVNRNKIDFIVDEFHGLPFFSPLYSRKPKLAVIQETARNVWFLNPFPKPFNWLVGYTGFICEPLFFLPYKRTKFMTGSNSAVDDVKKMGIPRNNIKIVSHGVIINKISPFLKKNVSKTIIFLGILSRDKGIEDALEVFSLLNASGDYNFWVVGRPETRKYQARIEYLTKKLNLKNNIKFWGFVPQEQKFKLLAQAHILINTSSREGWGLVNIEANAMGTPVVAYNNPGLIDSVKDNMSGVIVNNRTPQEVCKTVKSILADKQFYDKLSQGAKLWAKNFNWATSQQESLKLVELIAKDQIEKRSRKVLQK